MSAFGDVPVNTDLTAKYQEKEILEAFFPSDIPNNEHLRQFL